jgi:hypothetical protein
VSNYAPGVAHRADDFLDADKGRVGRGQVAQQEIALGDPRNRFAAGWRARHGADRMLTKGGVSGERAAPSPQFGPPYGPFLMTRLLPDSGVVNRIMATSAAMRSPTRDLPRHRAALLGTAQLLRLLADQELVPAAPFGFRHLQPLRRAATA